MRRPGAIKHVLFGFQRWRDERRRKRHEFMGEFIKGYMEYHRRPPQSREKYQEFHRRLQYIRPLVIFINLLLWYLMIRYLGANVIRLS